MLYLLCCSRIDWSSLLLVSIVNADVESFSLLMPSGARGDPIFQDDTKKFGILSPKLYCLVSLDRTKQLHVYEFTVLSLLCLSKNHLYVSTMGVCSSIDEEDQHGGFC